MTSRVVSSMPGGHTKVSGKIKGRELYRAEVNISNTLIGLTSNDIRTTTARTRLFHFPMPPVMGSFPSCPPHLLPHHALTGRVRPRASMSDERNSKKIDVMGSGACYPECSGLRHVPVITVRSWDNRR